jgi:hypothetical protein
MKIEGFRRESRIDDTYVARERNGQLAALPLFIPFSTSLQVHLFTNFILPLNIRYLYPLEYFGAFLL